MARWSARPARRSPCGNSRSSDSMSTARRDHLRADDSGEKYVLRSDDRFGPRCAATEPARTKPRSTSRSEHVASQGDSGQNSRRCVGRAGRRGRRGRTSPGSSGSPTRCCWSASRAAELATAAHPVLADGPSVLTLLETVTSALVARGLDPDATTWDAWRNEDGRWTVQMAWKAGMSDNVAHFRYAPGAHGGTVTAFDDAAHGTDRPELRAAAAPRGPVAQLGARGARGVPAPEPEPSRSARAAAGRQAGPPRKGHPAVPAWEDVLLGVRSSGGQR